MKKPGSAARAMALQLSRNRSGKLSNMAVRRALNPKTKQGRKRAGRIAYLSKDTHMKRYRDLEMSKTVAYLLGINLKDFIINGRKNIKVTEIGAGKGHLLKDVAKLCENFNVAAETVSMDINDFITEPSGLAHNRKVIGDVLKEPIPRSDLILSNWTLGYVGHPDYMTRKIAQTLKPGGMAILHFNSSGRTSSFLDLLSRGEIIIPGCEITAKKVDKSQELRFPDNLCEGDYW